MKKIFYLASLALVFACGGSESVEQETGDQKELSKVYYFDAENTTVGWTAYKTNDKIPVGGKFDVFTVNGAQESAEVLTILEGATFQIDVNSTNTGNPDRDGKIKNLFFGAFEQSQEITGSFKSLTDSSVVYEITLNGVSKEYQSELDKDMNSISFQQVLNLNDFNASAGVNALNEECHDLHKGADGVSRLWSEVLIEVSTTFSKK